MKEAVEFLGQCRLGQTERGSFVASILVPVPPEIGGQTTLGFGDVADPFQRRVTRLLMSALGTIRSALDDAALPGLLEAPDKGVSSNLYDAVADMLPEADQARVEVSMSWARSRSSAPRQTPSQVTMLAGEAITLSGEAP